MCREWREVGIIDHLQGLMGPPGQPSHPLTHPRSLFHLLGLMKMIFRLLSEIKFVKQTKIKRVANPNEYPSFILYTIMLQSLNLIVSI